MEDENDFHQLSNALETIDEDMICDKEKLRDYMSKMIEVNSCERE
tara:strand:- start:25 stop:159 length:135 start_codon:yes stop_codon:yes gene_type:complete